MRKILKALGLAIGSLLGSSMALAQALPPGGGSPGGGIISMQPSCLASVEQPFKVLNVGPEKPFFYSIRYETWGINAQNQRINVQTGKTYPDEYKPIGNQSFTHILSGAESPPQYRARGECMAVARRFEVVGYHGETYQEPVNPHVMVFFYDKTAMPWASIKETRVLYITELDPGWYKP